MLRELDAESGPRFALRSARVQVEGKYFRFSGSRARVRGVTYGPFARGSDGEPFPTARQVRADLERMHSAGINSVRTYCVPPPKLLEQVEDQGMWTLIDVPWRKHVCFLQSRRLRNEAQKLVRDAARLGRRSGAILAYSIGNEIPADIVRWHGARPVERFLATLFDAAKQADPDRLVTYANYPLTEYLDLSFLDFATFNVYLHNPAVFRNYLFRLQNLVGERPLVLGELGMDTIRHGEVAQSEFLASHVREATLGGVAGTFIFAWTDEWHTGGHPIDDWAFGITRADRSPKEAYHQLRAISGQPLSAWLKSAPRVSVVVCTYNGERTLDQCLASLRALDYPDYEVIVVNDGSTDDTRAVLARHPCVRTIHQENLGLSAARNVGLQASTGEIVAYIDSDCFADADWLTFLIDQLERTGAAAVGGPNLTPPGDWLSASVAASPGQPAHVLVDDQTAEHIPGCNMAFRRAALEAINGFDIQFRTAGDDVDICWRLQHDGYWISFAPGALVWHHRRTSPARYLRQQAGYGAAEGLLQFKHPDRFTALGSGKWRGVVYGARATPFQFATPIIYRGTFGTAMFQCLYQPSPAHWSMLPSTLEWHVIAALLAVAALVFAPSLAALTAIMLTLSLAVAALQGLKAPLPAEHNHWRAKLLVAILYYLQPVVRSWARYRERLIWYELPRSDPAIAARPRSRRSWIATQSVAYWSETGRDRIELLKKSLDYMNEYRIGRVIDSGWFNWDIGVYCQPGIVLKVATVQEDHGGGRRLVRVRYRLSITPWFAWSGLAGLLILAAVGSPWAVVPGIAVIGLFGRLWWLAGQTASRVVALFDVLAAELGMVPCPVSPS